MAINKVHRSTSVVKTEPNELFVHLNVMQVQLSFSNQIKYEENLLTINYTDKRLCVIKRSGSLGVAKSAKR